jgi:hypothetical protein
MGQSPPGAYSRPFLAQGFPEPDTPVGIGGPLMRHNPFSHNKNRGAAWMACFSPMFVPERPRRGRPAPDRERREREKEHGRANPSDQVLAFRREARLGPIPAVGPDTGRTDSLEPPVGIARVCPDGPAEDQPSSSFPERQRARAALDGVEVGVPGGVPGGVREVHGPTPGAATWGARLAPRELERGCAARHGGHGGGPDGRNVTAARDCPVGSIPEPPPTSRGASRAPPRRAASAALPMSRGASRAPHVARR